MYADHYCLYRLDTPSLTIDYITATKYIGYDIVSFVKRGNYFTFRYEYNVLAFTDQNMEQMARICKASVLCDPSKGEGYLNCAISKAEESYSAANRGGASARTNNCSNGGYNGK